MFINAKKAYEISENSKCTTRIVNAINEEILENAKKGMYSASCVFKELNEDIISSVKDFFEIAGYTVDCNTNYSNEFNRVNHITSIFTISWISATNDEI